MQYIYPQLKQNIFRKTKDTPDIWKKILEIERDLVMGNMLETLAKVLDQTRIGL